MGCIGIVCFFTSCEFVEKYRLRQQAMIRYASYISDKDSIYNRESKQVSFFPDSFNHTSRLYYIGKVWGFVKYYYENKSETKMPDIDRVLFDAILSNRNCQTKIEFENILQKMICSIQIDNKSETGIYSNINDYQLINNDWMSDTVCLSSAITGQLSHIFETHQGEKNNYVEINRLGRLLLKNELVYDEDFPEEEIRLLALFRYWNVINYFFVYKNFMDANWDRVLYESIPRFINIRDKKEYHWEFARLTRKLEDAHTETPNFDNRLLMGEKHPYFLIQKIDSLFYVKEILFPERNKPGFRVGDILLEIEKRNTIQYYDSLRNYVGSGSNWAQQYFLPYYMLSGDCSTMEFTLLRNGSDTLYLTAENKPMDELVKDWDERHRKNWNHNRWINDSTAYLNLRYLTTRTFDQNYDSIKHARNIILDLRSYPDTWLFEKVTDTFVPPSKYFYSSTYPDVRFPGMVRYKRNKVILGSQDYFKGTVVLLVDERTGSYSEFLSMALQQNPNLITVGRSTMGADGNIVREVFPGNINICYSGIGIYYPDFTPTQRCGIKIDYVAEPTVESLTNNIDVALEKAKELLIGGRV